MQDKNYLFVVNTLSGRKKNREYVIKQIKKYFTDAKIIVINNKEDFQLALLESQKDQYEYIIINGGDGTINSFLPVLIEQNKTLGIIPSGSGNGLARSLNIPLNPIEAVKIIQNQKVGDIDVGKIKIHFSNEIKEKYFVCAVGLGVDAAIAQRFEQQKWRGLSGYIWASIKEFLFHQSLTATIALDDKNFPPKKYLILSVMNIPQYGNDFYLAPSASINDGYLNVVLLEKVSICKYPYVLWNILQKKEKKPIKYYSCKKITITTNYVQNKYLHIDGEPMPMGNTIEIEVMPNALKIMK